MRHVYYLAKIRTSVPYNCWPLINEKECSSKEKIQDLLGSWIEITFSPYFLSVFVLDFPTWCGGYAESVGHAGDCQSWLQVWPLTQFFSCFLFVKTLNDPSSGKHYSLPFLPATPLSPSQTLEGLFELTRALIGPSTRLVRCFRNYRDSRTLSGVLRLPKCGGRRTRSRKAKANLDLNTSLQWSLIV